MNQQKPGHKPSRKSKVPNKKSAGTRTPAPRSRKAPPLDCIIIGAGAAGLACARALIASGRRVLILEARDRIGGRIHTVRTSNSSVPIELGAEFIHGAPRVTLNQLEAAGLTFYDLNLPHLQRTSRGLVPVEFFEDLQNFTQSLDAHREPDRTIEAAIRAHRLSGEAEKRVRTYIEGYHAADPSLVGERAIAIAEGGHEDLNGSEIFRISEGYDRMIDSFLSGAQAKSDLVRLNTIVKSIHWTRSRVDVTSVSTLGHELPITSAKTVVVTVPLGVLKSPASAKAAIEFHPHPPALSKALSGLHMGHVLRLNLQFRSRFWEKNRSEPIGFLHAGPDHDYPTWWTQMPLRTPNLIAWQGGPRTEKLARLTEAERVQTALKTLAFILDVDLEFLEEQLVSWHSHDWTNDPFSLGAYSFVGVNGDQLSTPLSRPFGNSLFFAGEATHNAAERGTVDGAIESGMRTAKQVLNEI